MQHKINPFKISVEMNDRGDFHTELNGAGGDLIIGLATAIDKIAEQNPKIETERAVPIIYGQIGAILPQIRKARQEAEEDRKKGRN